MSAQQEIINMQILEEAKSLMKDQFPVMIKYFLEDTDAYFKEIARAIREKNFEIAIIPAHTIKSSAKQIGADRISSIAEEIETICRDNRDSFDFKNFESLGLKLEAEIELASPELRKFI